MQPRQSFEQLEQTLRAEVCSDCPFRKKVINGSHSRECEASCLVFANLSLFKAVANQREQSKSNRTETMRSAITYILDQHTHLDDAQVQEAVKPLLHHQRRLATVLARGVY